MHRMTQQLGQNRDTQTSPELLPLLHISTALTLCQVMTATGEGHVLPKEIASVRRPGLQGSEFFHLWLRGVRPMRAQHISGSGLNTASCLTLPNFQK